MGHQNDAPHAGSLEAHVRSLGIPIRRTRRGPARRDRPDLGELAWLRQLVPAEAGLLVEVLFRGTRYLRRKVTADGDETTTEAGAGPVDEELQAYERWKRIYADQVRVALAHGIAQTVIYLAEREAETHGALVVAALDAAGEVGEARVLAINTAPKRFAVIHGGAA